MMPALKAIETEYRCYDKRKILLNNSYLINWQTTEMKWIKADKGISDSKVAVAASIDSTQISQGAMDVISALHEAGFQAYLVGGGVRDLLLDLHPKDFDIATDAHPEDVRELFDNSRIIGRRFRIVHVYFSEGYVEVATFRAAGRADVNHAGRIIADNTYGSIEEDAFRRDFTVNALFYDSDSNQVLDLVNGKQDIDAKLLRVIGDPNLRFREDPVRMLRAVRLANKLGFEIEQQAQDAIYRLGHLLSEVPSARLFDEMLKLFHGGFAMQTFNSLREFALFQYMFPLTEKILKDNSSDTFPNLVQSALQNTDDRIRSGKSVTPAFLFAVFLWGPMRKLSRQLELEGLAPKVAHEAATKDTILSQLQYTSIPKRFGYPMRDIWNLQYRFYRRRGKQVFRLFEHPRFRAAYDFLCLRATAGESVDELCEWWTVFQDVDHATQIKMLKNTRRKNNPAQHRANKKTYH